MQDRFPTSHRSERLILAQLIQPVKAQPEEPQRNPQDRRDAASRPRYRPVGPAAHRQEAGITVGQ